ncbi:MAG TPA: GH25 family lysozyme, partial [Anaerolineales bacterium]
MNRVAGIDVSHYQFEIDWPAVRASGVRFALIKATEGNFNDDFFAANWPAAKAAGIVRGPYHFYRPDVDAIAQAKFYLNAISLEPQDLPPAIDLEIHPNVSGKFYANPALLRGIQACVNAVADQTGQKLVIYTNLSFTKAFLAVSSGAVPGWLKAHTLWIANYNNQDDPNTHESWTNWMFWQYS